MPTETIFRLQLVAGYVACLLCFGVYVLPKLNSMERIKAYRVIAAIHSFRFFGLVFILPGVVGAHLPASFAEFAAYGDLATGVLAMLALVTFRIRALFIFFVAAFNVVGVADLLGNYYRAIATGVPAIAGELGSAYMIPVLYVPALMITHVATFYWMLRPQREASLTAASGMAAS